MAELDRLEVATIDADEEDKDLGRDEEEWEDMVFDYSLAQPYSTPVFLYRLLIRTFRRLLVVLSPRIIPTELTRPQKRVNRRMREIRGLLSFNSGYVPGKRNKNLEAILRAYRNGELKANGSTTVWFAGQLVIGPTYCSEEMSKIYKLAPKLTDKYGPGDIYFEAAPIRCVVPMPDLDEP